MLIYNVQFQGINNGWLGIVFLILTMLEQTHAQNILNCYYNIF